MHPDEQSNWQHTKECLEQRVYDALKYGDQWQWDAECGHGYTLLDRAAEEVLWALEATEYWQRGIYSTLSDGSHGLIYLLMAVDSDLREAMEIGAQWVLESESDAEVTSFVVSGDIYKKRYH